MRLYQAYGERQDINRLIPIVITSCIKDEEFPCSDGKQFRDFVYISDVVQAIIKSIHSKKSKGQVFNLGSSKPIKIKKLILMIRKKIGKGKPIFGKIKLRKGKFKSLSTNKKDKKINRMATKNNFKNGLYKTINFYKKIIKILASSF